MTHNQSELDLQIDDLIMRLKDCMGHEDKPDQSFGERCITRMQFKQQMKTLITANYTPKVSQDGTDAWDCAVANCGSTRKRKGPNGLCNMHYARLLRNGHVGEAEKRQDHEEHGLSETSEYFAWGRMISRCYNVKDGAYRYYGARGIEVCDEWRNSFISFISDIGMKPSPELSIDRINNDGNYEPGNCRWTTAVVQRSNQRKPSVRKDSPYGVSGVTAKNGKFQVKARQTHIGTYPTLEEAISARLGWEADNDQ